MGLSPVGLSVRRTPVMCLEGALKIQDVKMQDIKMTDQGAGHEIARHENAGHKYITLTICIAV